MQATHGYTAGIVDWTVAELQEADRRTRKLLTMYGTFKALRGDFTSASAYFARCVEVAPDNPAAHFNLAQAMERLGRLDMAEKHYRRALTLDPALQNAMCARRARAF